MATGADEAADLLQYLNISALQQLARRLGITLANLSKNPLMAKLAPELFKPEAIKHAVADLTPLEQEVLDRVVLAGGTMHREALRRQLTFEEKIEPRKKTPYGYAAETGSYRHRGSRKFEDILARLGVLGLLFSRDSYPSRNVEFSRPSEYLFVPESVKPHLPPVRLPPLKNAEPPQITAVGDADAVLQDVYALVSAAREEPLQLTKAGGLMKRSLLRVDGVLRVPEGAASARAESDLARLPLLRALVERLGLLVERGGTLVPGDEADDILRRSWGRRMLDLYQAYRETNRWSELSRLQQVTVSPKASMYDPHFQRARRQVLDQIVVLPAGQWIAIAELQGRFRRYSYEFLFRRNWSYLRYHYMTSDEWDPSPYDGSNSLGMRIQGYGIRLTWDMVEGVFIRTVVEALHWLGIVDIGSAGGTEPEVFRITVVGDAVLRGRAPEAPETETNVVVQPNFQVFAFPPTGQDVLFTLDRLARRVRAEQVVEYQLTRDSVYAAQRSGLEIDHVIAFLDQVSRTGIPQNVRRTLEEWGAQHDRIVIRRSTPLLQVAEAGILDALYADPSLVGLLGDRLAPTLALVPIQQIDAVLGALLARSARPAEDGQELLPALTEGDDARTPGAVDADSDGTIRPRQRVPSIFVLHALRPFAEDRGSALQLTQKSLRHAATRGYSAEEILCTLERLQGEPVSEELAAHIRRWAKNWGTGKLEEVMVLHVETPEILSDLLADPELRGLLRQAPGAPCLAFVRKDKADQVRALLEQRGMRLD